jgi:hypothetical protein
MDESLGDLLPLIAQQLESPDTPYVREAFERLLAEPDIDEEEARAMLAFCLADELEAMGTEDRGFDTERYRMILQLLPVMPEGR